MRIKRGVVSLVLVATVLQMPSAIAWDPQPTNPFPGVPFEGAIPGYSVEVPCKADGDCGIGIVPVINCPAWSAADGRNGYANDGPPGDPNKKVGIAWRFCRNSWLPPNTAADDEDFRNRQSLATAAATLESQAYSAANPGQQKCVTWGPIVHANGVSTASGGVCANPVGTTPSGTTVQVEPSQVGTTTNSATNSSASETASGTSVPTTPKAVVPDYSEYGVGKPFTKKLQGSKSTSECPIGFQAASNFISGVAVNGLTECWSEIAWAAYSVGGETWSAFKQSNGSLDFKAEQARVSQVNAIRALALQDARKAANSTPGLKRCVSWSGYGESGQECAYEPLQTNSGVTVSKPSEPTSSATETTTATTQPIKGIEIPGTRKYSAPGASSSQWESSTDYLAISCSVGSAKASGIDLNGTAISTDDRWFTYCVPINLTPVTTSETSTVLGTPNSVGDTATVTTVQQPSSDTSVATTKVQVNSQQGSAGATQPQMQSDSIEVEGSSKEISILISKVTQAKKESSALISYLRLLDKSRSSIKTSSMKIPSSTRVEASYESLTPKICKVNNNAIVSVSKGLCEYSITLVDSDDNKFTVLKTLVFRK